MPKCCQVNQHCKAPANAPGTTGKVECYACGQPVCTAGGCSVRIDYYNYGKQRLCEGCLIERMGDTPEITAGLIRLYTEWAAESGYPGEAGAVHVRIFMEPHRKALAEKALRKASGYRDELTAGSKLYGSCGGRFSGQTRSDGQVKQVVAKGNNWVVVDGIEGAEFFKGDLAELRPYQLPARERAQTVIPTSLGAVVLEYVRGKSGPIYRGYDEDGDRFEF